MNRVRCRCSTRCCFWSDCARGSVAVSQGGLTVGGIAKGVQTLWLDSGPTELKTSPSPLNDFLCSVSEAPPRVGVAFNEADRIKTTVPAAGRSCLHLQMEAPICKAAHICSDVSCHLTHFGSAHASVSLLGKAFNYFNTEFCSWRTFSFVDTDFGNSLRCLLTPLKQVIGSRWQRPVSLTVKLPAQKHSGVDRLAEGLRELYKRGEFTDVALAQPAKLGRYQFFLVEDATERAVGTATAKAAKLDVQFAELEILTRKDRTPRRGLSKSLLAAVLRRLGPSGRQLGLKKCSGRPQAIPLYLSFGFEPMVFGAEDMKKRACACPDWGAWKDLYHAAVARMAMDEDPGADERRRRGDRILAERLAPVCADRTFYAHRIVLAAESEVFKSGLASVSKELIDGRQEIRLAEISNPEAVKFMLDYMYQTDASVWEDYNPRTQEINKDVLRLAQTFRLPGLTERAMHWLAKDLTTGNVVEVLTICEDFGLSQLGERILEQLPVESKCF
eukprot:s2675_g6.t3